MEYICSEVIGNSSMGVNECWYESKTYRGIFYFDKDKIIKPGDKVVIVQNDTGFIAHIWVNGVQIK